MFQLTRANIYVIGGVELRTWNGFRNTVLQWLSSWLYVHAATGTSQTRVTKAAKKTSHSIHALLEISKLSTDFLLWILVTWLFSPVLDLLTILCLQLTFAQDGIILEEFSQMFLHFVIQFMFIMTSYMPCNRQHRKIFYRNTKEKKLRHKHAQGQFACNNQLCRVFIDKKNNCVTYFTFPNTHC